MDTFGVDVLIKKSFGCGDEDERLSGNEYFFDLSLNLEGDFFLCATLLGEADEVVDKDDTLVFAGDGGVGGGAGDVWSLSSVGVVLGAV